jgi:hypothetical protein
MRKFLAIFACLVLLVVVLGACGGGKTHNFPKTHEGKYFTIGYPEDFKVEADDEGVSIGKEDSFAVQVRAQKEPVSKEGNLESIKMYVDMITGAVKDEEGVKLDMVERKIDGVNGYFIKAVDEKKGQGGYAVMVPLDGAVIMIMTDDLTKLEYLALAEEIINSVAFTNKAFFKEPAKDPAGKEGETTDPAGKEGTVTGDAFTFEGISVVPAPGWTPKTEFGILNLQKSQMENISIMKIPGVDVKAHAESIKKSFEGGDNPLPITMEQMTIGSKEFTVLTIDMQILKTYNLLADFNGTTVVVTLTSELNDEVKGMIESITLE